MPHAAAPTASDGSWNVPCGRRPLPVAVLIAVAVVSGVAAPPPQSPCDCRLTERKIVIDGSIDEPAWQDAVLIDRFFLPWLAAHDPPAMKATRDVRALFR